MPMNGQRQRARGGRRRRRKTKDKGQAGTPVEPILIAARRPNSPVLGGSARPRVAASAKPTSVNVTATSGTSPQNGRKGETPVTPVRRTARIVQLDGKPRDEREIERRRLLQRLLDCEGRSTISRAAEAYLSAGFEFPE